MIEPTDPSPLRRMSLPRASLPEARQLQTILAALFPLVALAALVYGMHRVPVLLPDQAGPGLEVPRSAYLQATQSFEKRRLRHLLEAHRYAHGNWPESLSELEGARILGDVALTAAQAESYYYRRLEDGYLLLAPER